MVGMFDVFLQSHWILFEAYVDVLDVLKKMFIELTRAKFVLPIPFNASGPHQEGLSYHRLLPSMQEILSGCIPITWTDVSTEC